MFLIFSISFLSFWHPGWAHVVCALYIPEVQFANVLTMEPIVLQYVPHDRFNKVKERSITTYLTHLYIELLEPAHVLN